MERVSIYPSKRTLDWVKDKCIEEKRNMSNFILKLIEAEMEREEEAREELI